MKWGDVLKVIKPLASVAASFIPGGPAVIAAVNEFLPDKDKLTPASTGEEIINAVDSLPADQRAAFMSKEIDLKIAQEEGWTERYIAMTKADGQSTRPKIALMMAQVLSFEILAFTVWCFIFPEQMVNPVLWTVFGTLTAPPVTLLVKYFGELRKEQANRLGVTQPSMLQGLFGLKTK